MHDVRPTLFCNAVAVAVNSYIYIYIVSGDVCMVYVDKQGTYYW